jgi:hypothetical protein
MMSASTDALLSTSASDDKQRLLFKDEILGSIAETANVAQFVSFSPDLEQRLSRVWHYEPNHVFPSPATAIAALLKESPEESVNVRSFDPLAPESREFVYGLRSVEDVLGVVERLNRQGLHTIVNETVNVDDGGVSGVLLGDVIEFAPKDTPRCVEKPGVASLPRSLGIRLLTSVYGFAPEFDWPPTTRVEFSLHPIRRGVRHGHTIIWQIEDVGDHAPSAAFSWPNRFSKFIGDKTFGLLVAHLLGAHVPKTRVIPRWLTPFAFGEPTGTSETWIRTCPTEQQPGKFTTAPKWLDPFALMQREDPDGDSIAAVLAQEGVEPLFSGALVVDRNGNALVEGVSGKGDEFMVGRQGPSVLPERIRTDVIELSKMLSTTLGPVRMEWVHDGERVWVVQLHRGAIESNGRVIVPGKATRFRRFAVEDGIEAFRAVVADAKSNGEGITLVGCVGVTSHFGDILRRSQVPSRIESSA